MGRGKFTVNEVEERTKVPAGTLRQWERRYGFPCPERSDSGYRLYSEDDIRSIETMKHHIADGIPASRAAELVKEVPRDPGPDAGRPPVWSTSTTPPRTASSVKRTRSTRSRPCWPT